MGENDNANRKFLLPNGRQTVDYIDEAGFLYGFCIGNAVRCRYKAGLETDPERVEKLLKDCNWYMDCLARRKNMVREEIVSIVKSIVSRMERDRLAVPQKADSDGSK